MTVAGSRKVLTVIGSVAVVALGLVASGGSAARGAPSRVPLAAKAPKGTAGSFTAVTRVPHSSDIWTIGATTRPFEARRHHGHWQQMAPIALGPAADGGAITTVAAGSSNAVWVGGDKPYQHSIQDIPAIWRLKGKKFLAVKLPNMENGVANVSAISASSATNAWAVGVIYVLPAGSLDALHWNGKKWSPVAFPEPGFDQTPISVSVSSPNNAWATDGTNLYQWNGKVWAQNGVGPAGVFLESVATSGPKLAYAVGFIQGSTGANKTVVMRYNGTSWSNPALAKGTGGDTLLSVSIAGTSAWAVGYHDNPTKDTQTPVILHTAGGAWKSQGALAKSFSLRSVSAASAKRVYAVGSYRHGTRTLTFLDFYNGHSWQGVPAKL